MGSPGWVSAVGRGAMMASKSVPAPSEPKLWPQWPARRESQKAPNTAAGAVCASSAACTASATSCARRRASISVAICSTRDRQAVGQVVQRRVHAARWRQFVRQRRGGIGLAQRAQQVQRHDVACAFPDAVERHLAVDARHDAFAALFHIAVAAQALHGFLGEVAAALADPELGHGREQALHHALVLVARPLGRSCGPDAGPARWRPRTPARGRPARFSSAAVRSAPCQRPGAATCGSARCDSAWRIRPLVPSAQSSRVIVPMARICGTPRPSSPTSQAVAPDELDLGAGVGLVAQLVLQALDEQLVQRAVGQHARQEQAAQAAKASAPGSGRRRTSAPRKTTCGR